MKNLLMQSRAVTKPVKHPLIGWWHEYFFFYVKLRDLTSIKTKVEAMLLTNTALSETQYDDANVQTYKNAGGFDYGAACLDAVVAEYFRDEEEVVALHAPTFNGLPMAKANLDNWTESLKLGADAPISDGVPLSGDHWPELPEHLAGFSDAYTQWKQMQQLEMVPATFEDYLKTFGVRPPRPVNEQTLVPELLRYVREWKYPANTIDPATGAASAALSWTIAERADKDRFFAEPGFVFGVTVTRPKVYLKNQTAALSTYLTGAYDWLPALLAPDPFTSLKKFTGLTGPVPTLDEDYWLDIADIFHSGDQFVNFAPAADAAMNGASLPVEQAHEYKLNKRYPSSANINELFVSGASAADDIVVDGRVDLTILTRVVDSTP
jgi:hypothetical protein